VGFIDDILQMAESPTPEQSLDALDKYAVPV
jgi:hypothetical protein